MITSLKVKSTILVRVNFETKICRRYSGRSETHGYLFESEEKITPELVASMRQFPDTVGIVEAPREAA